MDGGVREEAFGHLVGALAGASRVVGVEVDIESVGAPKPVEVEAEPFERLARLVSLGVEHPVFEPDRHRRGVGCHTRGCVSVDENGSGFGGLYTEMHSDACTERAAFARR